MTAKRFWLVSLEYYGEQRFVRDNNQIGEKSISNQEVVDTLNKFQELSIADLKQIEQLKKENEQLKQRLESKEKAHTRCDGLYWKLYDEKEQLKKRLDEVLKELYCKDRRLEELGEDIECCDKQ